MGLSVYGTKDMVLTPRRLGEAINIYLTYSANERKT
jgi:hypothetical protein